MRNEIKSSVRKILKTLKVRAVELLSLFIAACALFLTIYQVDATNRHNRLSVLPILQISYENNRGDTIITIENVGTGPAIITELEVGGKKANSIEPTVIQFEKSNKLDFTNLKVNYVKTAKRIVVQAGSALTMVKVDMNTINNEKSNRLILTAFLKEIPITACYRSVYGDRLYLDAPVFESTKEK